MPTLLRLAAASLLLSGCVMSPFNGQAIESTTDWITFSGYSLYGGQTVRIYASDDPEGPFSSWPGAHATTWETPIISGWPGGQSYPPLYPFSTQNIINTYHWGSEPGPGACTTPVTYVQMRETTNDFPFYSFDEPTWPQVHPTVCINNAIAAGSSFYDAVPACASDDSPTIRITADPICP